MKRAFVALIAILYLTATSGVAMSVHWCMGKASGASLVLDAAGDHYACRHCGMEKKKKGGCCHDEYKIVKVEKDQSIAAPIIVHLSTACAPPLMPVINGTSVAFCSEALMSISPAHGPPLVPRLPVYLRVRSIRI